MAKGTRIEQLRESRSLNEILSVVDKIKTNIRSSGKHVKMISTSALEFDFNDKDLGQKVAAPTAKPANGQQIDFKVKLSATDSGALEKNFKLLNDLYENAEELDNAESLILNNFKTAKKQKAVLTAIKALKDEVNDTINSAMDKLNEIGDKNLPKPIADIANSIERHLDKSLAGSFGSNSRDVFVAPGSVKGSFDFCVYLGYNNLKNEQGFIYPHYYFVITAKYVNGKLGIYMNALPQFKTPGKYPPGQQIASVNDAIRHADMLLAHNKFAPTAGRKPVTVGAESLKTGGITNIRNVEDVNVVNDEIVVRMKAALSDALLTKTATDVMARLSGILKLNHTSTRLVYKTGMRGGKSTLTFTLISNVDNKHKNKAMHFNVAQLNEAADFLDLDDKQRAALRFALQS